MSSHSSTKVGIVIPTMNRVDFIIRQLEYYASLSSPHPIYIIDSSNPLEAARIQTKIDELKNRLNIIYYTYPPGDIVSRVISVLEKVKEKYVCSAGDDDFRVPNTLTECADFLETNPDYKSAIGQSVTIRIENNMVYGKLTSIHDYPRYPMESESASDRLTEYLSKRHSSIIVSVIKTADILKYYKIGTSQKDDNFRGEMLPSFLMVINGKSKVMNKLDLVRQIHANHFKIADIFDQITDTKWPETYQTCKKELISALIEKDGISHEQAEIVVKRSFWEFLMYLLSRFNRDYVASIDRPKPEKIKIRTKIAIRFPFIKKMHKKAKLVLGLKEKLHYQVTQPNSDYYKDFQPIVLSLRKK